MRLFNIDYNDLGVDDLSEIGEDFNGDHIEFVSTLQKGGWIVYTGRTTSKSIATFYDILKNGKRLTILFLEGFGRFNTRFSIYLGD